MIYCHNLTQLNFKLVVLHSWSETFLYHLLLTGATQTFKQPLGYWGSWFSVGTSFKTNETKYLLKIDLLPPPPSLPSSLSPPLKNIFWIMFLSIHVGGFGRHFSPQTKPNILSSLMFYHCHTILSFKVNKTNSTSFTIYKYPTFIILWTKSDNFLRHLRTSAALDDRVFVSHY